MDTVRLLNSYRKAVTRDRDAVHVLAFLHRDGPQEEVEIAAKVEKAVADVRSKLTELYRANLVVLLDESRFATSDLAEQILTEIGVADVVARATLDAARLPDDDRAFLTACLTQSQRERLTTRRYLSTALRAAALIAPSVSDAIADQVATWYAVIAGLDPAAHEFGADAYCRHVAARSPANDVLSGKKLSHFIVQCKTAIDLRSASNRFLADGALPLNVSSDAVLALTFIRLFSSAVTRSTDDGLSAAFAAGGVGDTAVQRLKSWTLPFYDNIEALPWGGLRRDLKRSPEFVRFLVTHVAEQPWSSWSRLEHTDVGRSAVQAQETLQAALLAIEERTTLHEIGAGEAKEALAILDRIQRNLASIAEPSPRKSRTRIIKRRPSDKEWSVQILEPDALRETRGARIVKVNNVPVRPMSIEEAALRLDDSKNEFIVFRNVDTDKVEIIRRRGEDEFDILAPVE